MGIVKQYLALCWFDSSPYELPKSIPFFKRNLIFNFLVFFFIHFNMTDELESVTEVFFETVLSLGFIALTLWLNDTLSGYVQVSSAILFSENLVSLFLVPIMFWVTVAEDWYSYGVLAFILLWAGGMIAAIFKKALAINLVAGLVMSLFYVLFSFGGGFAVNSLVTG